MAWDQIDRPGSALEETIARLREQLQDRDDDTRAVLAERGAGDEVHCSCVPILRRALARKNRVIAERRSKEVANEKL